LAQVLLLVVGQLVMDDLGPVMDGWIALFLHMIPLILADGQQ
jgi:hypothetical protein